ncbi:MAG TPA: YqgE/AlgH family protein [Burkholderiales bacterium]|nr:YqgE/AlgH family protein [Burkholderiales bacterium]
MKPRSLAQCLLLAVLAISAVAAQAADLSKSVILVAKPELTDALYGSAILVVTPIGGDQHAGFIVNRPTGVKLSQLFPEDGPSQKVVDPVYLGGPFNPQVIFALVESNRNPGGQSLELMPGLYAAVEADTVDNIIRTAPEHARFVAGLVLWQPGELRTEIERGVWYVLAPDAHLALQPSQGLWEELVRTSKLRANAI